jgi:hypothetical protein
MLAPLFKILIRKIGTALGLVVVWEMESIRLALKEKRYGESKGKEKRRTKAVWLGAEKP